MNKKKLIIIGVAVIGVAAAALAASKFLGGNKKQAGAMMMAQKEAAVPVVKAANPFTGNISLSTGLTGTVEPSDVVYVYAKASGDVTDVLVKAGDTVAAGDVLLEIDTEQVETARNSMEAAEVSLSEAQSNLNRMQILYAGGDLSDQEYEQYVNRVTSSRLQYESAKLAYDRQMEYSRVTAPINGKVESCDIEVHDRVSQSSQLCVIAGEGEKRVSFYVTERMKDNISEGDELTIMKNGSSYQAYISEISSMVDSATGLFKVKAELKNTDAIATGSTVKLNLITEKTEQAMLIPVDAIYYSGGNAYVYLCKDGKAVQTPIEVGIYDSENAEVLSGLNMDDIVVSTWSSNLYEGATIKLKGEQEKETAPAQAPQSPEGPAPAAR